MRLTCQIPACVTDYSNAHQYCCDCDRALCSHHAWLCRDAGHHVMELSELVTIAPAALEVSQCQ